MRAVNPYHLTNRHNQSSADANDQHEKMCVIDETIAFMGGLDLCYGRWDTSQHVLIDEDHTDPDGPNGPVWRGKDYSNERVVEFSNLDKPFEDSIDRKKVPRMPWCVFPPLNVSSLYPSFLVPGACLSTGEIAWSSPRPKFSYRRLIYCP
jgi:hypothetical protein